jgi:hypothetical protein
MRPKGLGGVQTPAELSPIFGDGLIAQVATVVG